MFQLIDKTKWIIMYDKIHSKNDYKKFSELSGEISLNRASIT